jgi:hypothetical protein
MIPLMTPLPQPSVSPSSATLTPDKRWSLSLPGATVVGEPPAAQAVERDLAAWAQAPEQAQAPPPHRS